MTPDLIERVSAGDWDRSPAGGLEARNALAARGYWQAFQLVKADVARILDGENAAEIVSERHADWRAELFRPLVNAGFIKPVDLIGYLASGLYPRLGAVGLGLHPAGNGSHARLSGRRDRSPHRCRSRPLRVHLHPPFGDGNGRTGRFIMNAMLASGGYPWTIIPVARKPENTWRRWKRRARTKTPDRWRHSSQNW